jgi:hypothetical protein
MAMEISGFSAPIILISSLPTDLGSQYQVGVDSGLFQLNHMSLSFISTKTIPVRVVPHSTT